MDKEEGGEEEEGRRERRGRTGRRGRRGRGEEEMRGEDVEEATTLPFLFTRVPLLQRWQPDLPFSEEC